MILLLLIVLLIFYMFGLIRKGLIISSSSFWLVLFFIIYIIPLLYREGFFLVENIQPETLTLIAQISLLVLISFMLSNTIFLRANNNLNKVLPNRQFSITFKRLFIAWVLVFGVLGLLILYFARTISIQMLISEGSKLLLEESDISIIPIEACIFFLNLISILMFEESRGLKQKTIMSICIIASSMVSFTFVFGRRILIFPIVVVWALHYMRSKNKKRLILFTIPFVGALFFIMIIMMSARTFGINNALLGLSSFFNNENPVEIIQYFASATDFSYNVNYLAIQLQTEDVSVTPLTYLKPLFLLIPRSFWPDKPEAFCVLIMRELGINLDVPSFSAGTGIVGEALATLGTFGLVLIPSLWGAICGLLDSHIYKRYTCNGVLSQTSAGIFAYLFFMIQTITGAHRGDTGNAVIEFIMVISPTLVLLRILCKKKAGEYNLIKIKDKSSDALCEV